MSQIVLGIDPGLANTGWGIVVHSGRNYSCLAYGCISTDKSMSLTSRLFKIYEQISAVIEKYKPTCVGIESVLFNQNVASAFKTGQARGAALVACAHDSINVGEFSPTEIKMAVAGTGSADKQQIQYMVAQTLKLDHVPKPDHSSDALAAALCYIFKSPMLNII